MVYSRKIFSAKNRSSGFYGALKKDFGFNDDIAANLFEEGCVFLLGKYSTAGVTKIEVQLVLDSKIGSEIGGYIKRTFNDATSEDQVREKLKASIPLFEEDIMKFISIMRKKFD